MRRTKTISHIYSQHKQSDMSRYKVPLTEQQKRYRATLQKKKLQKNTPVSPISHIQPAQPDCTVMTKLRQIAATDLKGCIFSAICSFIYFTETRNFIYMTDGFGPYWGKCSDSNIRITTEEMVRIFLNEKAK